MVAKPRGRSKKLTLTKPPPERVEPVVVPVGVLSRLMAPDRGGLPDPAYRPTIKTTGGDEGLLALLTTGLLVVRTKDFEGWYRSERAKGKWASQRSRKKKPEGRPTKQTEALKNAIFALVRDLKWNGKAGIAALHSLLVISGRSDIPSPDTLAQLPHLRKKYVSLSTR